MASERSVLKNNKNGSKNTRMDLASSLSLMDFRKDELMHIGRYMKACETAITLSKELKRPIRILDLGCGEIYSMRTLYKSFIVKKSDVVKKYIGIDIDEDMLERTQTQFSKVLEAVNGKVLAQDLTVNPKFRLKDETIDLVIWFEMIEHIKPEFVMPLFKEVRRVMRKDAVLLLSTPNADGSNSVLPKDHVYEWGYEELKSEILNAGFIIQESVGTCINPSKIPSEIKSKRERDLLKKCIQLLAITPLSVVLLLDHSFQQDTVRTCYGGS